MLPPRRVLRRRAPSLASSATSGTSGAASTGSASSPSAPPFLCYFFLASFIACLREMPLFLRFSAITNFIQSFAMV